MKKFMALKVTMTFIFALTYFMASKVLVLFYGRCDVVYDQQISQGH